MPRLGLALSGGGFRATLYHLGIVRFLKDADQLQYVTDIASASGGSILSAHLALNWDRYTGDDEKFDEAAEEIVKFVQFDVRNRIVRRLPLQYPLRYLAKLVPIDTDKLTPNAVLERYYRELLYGDRRLYELPDHPDVHILATDVINGGASVFNREGLFIKQRGDVDDTHVGATMASIPRVVGASSAFPGLFPPAKFSADDLGAREGQFTTEWFTDGGVYDNLGVRAFRWLTTRDQQFDQILVSDAGKPFQCLTDAALGMIGQSMRASDILWDRVWQLERENFGQQDGYAFLPITEQVGLEEDPTALHPVIQAEVQSIRTDLDRFSDLEINALAQHGYGVARKICHQIGLVDRKSVPNPPWAPVAKDNPLAKSTKNKSSAKQSKDTQYAMQLRKSSQRRTLSTLLSLRDWTSYVYLALGFVLFIWLPFAYYQAHRRAIAQDSVIQSIRNGVPEVGEVLDLVAMDPAIGWTAEPIGEKPQATPLDFTGVEIVTHSRIIDLRSWNAEATVPEQQGHIYVRERVTMKLSESYTGNRRVTFHTVLPLDEVECRQTNSFIKGTISKITEPTTNGSEPGSVYEIEYDLRKLPLGQQVTLELEMLAKLSERMSTRAPFVVQAKTDLLIALILFPAERPYDSFNLVKYPTDRSAPPQAVDVRHRVKHSSGSLMGWSVVNPEVDAVYECRWTE